MKNTIIVSLFFLIISDAFCSDTIRINLSVNYKVISNPSKEIQLKFRTKNETVLSYWINDSMLYIPNLSDTSQIVLLFNDESNIKNRELGSCFKYSPNGFSQIEAVNIWIYTDRKKMKAELKKMSQEYSEIKLKMKTKKEGRLHDIFEISIDPKGHGDGSFCKSRSYLK